MLILLLWLPTAYGYIFCDLKVNCSLPQWNWASILSSCPTNSVANFPCNISSIPPFALDNLNSRSLELPHCSAKTFQWQSLFTSGSQQVDVSHCPLNCSCDTNWIGSNLEHLNVKSPQGFRCSPTSCVPSYLVQSTKADSPLNEPYSIEFHIRGEVLSKFLNTGRRYFKWQGSRSQHNHSELITEHSIRLDINNVTKDDLGVINVFCWHCRQPTFASFQLKVPVPLSLAVEASDSSYFRLAVQGHPINNLILLVTDSKGKTVSQQLPPSTDTKPIKLWDTLLVRSDAGHSMFHRRVFKIFTTSCSNCSEDHLAGDFNFTFCSSQVAISHPKQAECRSISHHFNRINTSEMVHVTSNFDTKISPEPVVIVVLVLFSLVMAAALLNAKLHTIKTVGWRKWRWSFRSRLSRRTSHATEETMLRLEERLSMSSSDYTGHVIPCIKGGAVQIHEQIGKGAFGAVYCGTWEQTGPRSVAVKALADADAEVEKEATVLCRLDHENIVRLYGLTRDGNRLLLVFEMMRLGDLRSYLKNRTPQQGNYASFPAALDETELKYIIRQVAKGLCYLVAQQIIHRDLAARNCLVDGDSDQMIGNPRQRPPISVKISDFGMSRRLTYHSDYYRMQNQSLLPVRWLPPEAISEHRFSSKSDIWSLGVTMWEIFSYGSVPFDTLSNHEVVSYALAGMRPPKPKHCPNDVYALMERCWELDPDHRLSAEDVLLDPAIAPDIHAGPL